MKEVKISEANALNAFKKADKTGKELLSNLIGDQIDFSIKITDRVKTFEDACEVLGISPGSVLVSSSHIDSKGINAFAKICVIAKALNEGWVPDWNDSDQCKYYPWLEYKSGSGFSYYGCDYDYSYAAVGSRLCYKSSELAKYAGKQFNKEYNEFFTI